MNQRARIDPAPSVAQCWSSTAVTSLSSSATRSPRFCGGGSAVGVARPSLISAESSRQRHIVWFTLWQAIAVRPWPRCRASRCVDRRSAVATAAAVGAGSGDGSVRLADRPGCWGVHRVFAVTGLDEERCGSGTVWAILIAHVFFNYAVVVRTVGAFWGGLDPRMEEAARSLGATAWAAFREVTLPRLRPAIASAAAIVFLFSFTSFGVVLILGGPRRATLETEIYRQAVTRTDLETAAALAVVQLVAVLALVVVSTRLERRRPIVGRCSPSRRAASPVWRW